VWCQGYGSHLYVLLGLILIAIDVFVLVCLSDAMVEVTYMGYIYGNRRACVLPWHAHMVQPWLATPLCSLWWVVHKMVTRPLLPVVQLCGCRILLIHLAIASHVLTFTQQATCLTLDMWFTIEGYN